MAGQDDITAAKGTYSGFLKLLKWSTAVSIAAAAIVVLIIAR